MYSNLQWLDHAVTPDRTFKMQTNSDGTVTLTPAGKVIQQGTNMSAANFNNMEMGLTDHDLAVKIFIMALRQIESRTTDSDADIEQVGSGHSGGGYAGGTDRNTDKRGKIPVQRQQQERKPQGEPQDQKLHGGI